MIKERIEEILKELPKGVQLIAVTKTHPAHIMNEAIDCGITDIGENKVQEVLAKYDDVKPVRWHLIGHLQTNKVKQIVDKVYMIHSVDSLHLAEEINKRCEAIGKVMNVLIQVNMAAEEQKSGIEPENVLDLANAIVNMKNLKLRGLMFIAPAVDNPEDVRVYFKQMKKMFDDMKKNFGDEFDTLSMGMSNDYMVAAEEGATCVRVGSKIFGQRDYSKKFDGDEFMNNKVLSIQDISCFGQCSTTVALPIVSACGVECAILPSAVLSTHTAGDFRKVGFTCCDLDGEFPKIEDKWNQLGIKFGSIYTGYLGTTSMIKMVMHIMDSCLEKDGLRIVDPAMADGGQLYPAFNMEYVDEMKLLCGCADYIIPNISEGCFLTGMEYKEEYDETYVNNLCKKLSALGCKNIILTGVGYEAGKTGVVAFCDGEYKYFEHEKLSKSYHGTGDIYSSVFVGAKMRGLDTFEAAKLAANYTYGCIKDTISDESHWYGVKFELSLAKLGAKINELVK